MTHLCAQHQVSRPSLKDVHATLVNWGGVVVHFSGVPAGMLSNFNKAFPDDLLHILAGQAQSGISCSVVRAGDRFEELPGDRRRNSWGCIGVIVRGRTEWSLVCVDAGDCGSFVDGTGFRQCNGANRDLSIREIEGSLYQRSIQDCNEWVMMDYDVVGVLVQPPFSVRSFGDQATEDEIRTYFAHWPLYSFHNGGLYEIEVTPELKYKARCDIASLYP